MSDRKYRHRGYQDDDRNDPRNRPSGQSRPSAPHSADGTRPDGGPRGRGLGAPTEVVFKCALCGREEKHPAISATSICPGCGKPLHSCTNCSFFNSGAPLECTKPIAARIENKSRANDCSYFEPKTLRSIRGDAGTQKPVDARAAFNALFKK